MGTDRLEPRMRRLKKSGSSILAPLSLILFAVLTHRAWFSLGLVLSSGDWKYWPEHVLGQMMYQAGGWISYLKLGYPNIQIYFLGLKLVWGILSKYGLSFGTIAMFSVLVPIALGGFLTPYVFTKRLTENKAIGVCIALFYGTITYFLIRQTTHLFIALVFAFAPLVLNQLLIAIEKNRSRDWIILAFLFSFISCGELRITYIIACVAMLLIVAYCLPKPGFYWRNIFLFGVISIGLGMFWFLPTMFGGLSGDVAAATSRGLFGNSLFDLKHALTISDSSWTGSYPDRYFIMQPVMLTAWVAPILALLSPLIVKKPRRLLAAMFLLIAIIGILLTKQSSPPWPGLYLWLYEHAPGFNLFREASKFYLLTAVGYSGLLALGMEGVLTRLRGRGKQIFMISATVLFLLLAAYNTKPLISGEIGTMFKPRTISNDYIVFEKFLNGQEGFFRTLWVPYYSRYGAFSTEHPKVSLVKTNDTGWSEIIGDDIVGNQTKSQNIVALLKRKDAQTILADSSIKYVIIPIKDIQNDDNFFRSYGNSRQYFINEIRKLKYLKPVEIGAKDLLVFENKQYVPHLQGKNLTFKQINPTKYLVSIRGIKGSTVLKFNEAYHKGWKLYGAKGLELRGQKIEHPPSTTEVLDDYSFMQGEDISYLWLKSAFDKTHRKTRDSLNEWTVDAETIKKSWPKNSYHLNSDGSVDVELVVYFKPQSYFYLGLIVSLLTALSCIGYLTWDWRQRRKRSVKRERTAISPAQQSTS